MSKNSAAEALRERDVEKIEETRQIMSKYGYFPVENDAISAVWMETPSALSAYLRQLPKRLYEENTTNREGEK